MENMYENKRVCKFYFIVMIFLIPLVIATIKWAGFDIIDTVIFVPFYFISPYVVIALILREAVLHKIDKKDIINVNEMKIKKWLATLG